MCYLKALSLKNLTEEDERSLKRRLGNVRNELGVFYMNQSTTLVHSLSGEESSDVASSTMLAARDLLVTSREFLQAGIELFQEIQDSANIALLLSNSGRLWRIAGHIKSQTRQKNKDEFGDAEMVEYKKAISDYQIALQTLGIRKVNPGVWDSVNWELCCTYFTVGTLLQDQAPLSSTSREDAEKQVTEYFLKSLKFCDTDTAGSRQVVYQYRVAVIHQRLASLYHHSYRCFDTTDSSFRKKKLKQLSENHYMKAAPIFLQLDRLGDCLRSILEKCGLYEAQLEGQTTGAKLKLFSHILSAFVEAVPVLERMQRTHSEERPAGEESCGNEDTMGKEDKSGEEEEEVFLVGTLLQRVQATLLQLFKVLSNKTSKKGKEQITSAQRVKALYGESLKIDQGVEVIVKFLNKIKELSL